MDKIAIFLYRLRFGGAERVMLTLAGELLRNGHEVDIVAFEASGEFSDNIPKGAGVVSLGSPNISKVQKKLAQYIDETSPKAILANGDRCTMAAFLARRNALKAPTVISVVHNDLIGARGLGDATSFKSRFLAMAKKIPMAFIYGKIDAIVAVSEGVADSVHRFLGYPREKIFVIYNPVDVDDIRKKAEESVDHPWFEKHAVPVVISSGRLSWEKDFPTLIRAFHILSKKIPVRLAIMGEGSERRKLENLIDELGLNDSASLMGFEENPFKYIARSDLFVMSSVFEGFGLAIAETMALGIPIVSTNCPSGPAELLRCHPERLVPMRDPETLANVMERELFVGREENDMSPYSVQNCARRYINLIYR
jgi:glycosyltransferase involved in cell wall biosynthesis